MVGRFSGNWSLAVYRPHGVYRLRKPVVRTPLVKSDFSLAPGGLFRFC